MVNHYGYYPCHACFATYAYIVGQKKCVMGHSITAYQNGSRYTCTPRYVDVQLMQ